ncbi:PAP/25A associated domain containing protein [Aphelenchoides avenae]|nr:PAP/25A associated domain containing protein [Aphelenchus avenae]
MDNIRADGTGLREGTVSHAAAFKTALCNWSNAVGLSIGFDTSDATPQEKAKVLPKTKNCFYCRAYCTDFPGVLFAFGYGATHKQCQISAAKALVDKLHAIGLITDSYFANAGINRDKPFKLDWTVMRKRLTTFAEELKTNPTALTNLTTVEGQASMKEKLCAATAVPARAAMKRNADDAFVDDAVLKRQKMGGQEQDKGTTFIDVKNLKMSPSRSQQAADGPVPNDSSRDAHMTGARGELELEGGANDCSSAEMSRNAEEIAEESGGAFSMVVTIQNDKFVGVQSMSGTETSASGSSVTPPTPSTSDSIVVSITSASATVSSTTRAATSAAADLDDGEVSDGEDLLAVFPVQPADADTNSPLAILHNDVEISDEESDDDILIDEATSSSSTEAVNDGHIWREKFGVTPTPMSGITRKVAELKRRFEHAFKGFNRDIWTHFVVNLQNEETFAFKMRVRQELHAVLQRFFPVCNLIAVGSTVNGCGSYNSDMDLCLTIPCPVQGLATERDYAMRHLGKLRNRLQRQAPHLIQGVLFIKAVVPILRIFTPSGLELDLNVNNTAGVYNSYLLHYYARIDDRFSALCLTFKHWAKVEGIGDAVSGTFNSYSLILMVIHYLQCASDPPILPNLQQLYPEFFREYKPFAEMRLFGNLPAPLPSMPKNTKTVGELLIGLFDYYARFNFKRMAISVSRGCRFPR